MLRSAAALLGCTLCWCIQATDCALGSMRCTSFIRPPAHPSPFIRVQHATDPSSSSSSSSSVVFPLKRVPTPSRDLPNFVSFNSTAGAWDPLRRRRFSDSVVNFIRRAIEVWRPSKEPPPGWKKRRASGTMEWARFLKACFVERKYLTLSSLALVGAAFCEVSVPHYSSVALNAVLVSRDMQQFASAVRMLITLGCAASALTFVRAALFGLAGTRVATRARVQLLKSLLTQEMGFFDNRDSGELTNRLSADCAKLSTVISSHINVMLRQTIQLIGGSYYLFRLNPQLAWVTLTGVTAIGLLTALHGEFIRRMGRRSQDVLAEANAVAGHIIGLIRVVRAHGSEERELMRYSAELKRTVSMLETHDLGHSVYRSIVRFLQTLLQAAVMSLGALSTIQGRMTGEQLTAFLFYVNFVNSASFDVGDRWTAIQDAIGSTASVFSLTDRRPKMQIREDLKPRSRHHQHGGDRNSTVASASSSPGGPVAASPVPPVSVAGAPHNSTGPHLATLETVRGRMVFRNVTFAYPLRGAIPVLKSLNVVIPAGKRTAIVGGSGAGKSTLMRLMCRFYDPDQGAVLLDGRDVRTFTQKELTRRIVFLAQEPQLMPISIYENIAYGLEDGSYGIEDVVRAAKDANVHDFILSLPHKYSTRVGENSLSGGQKQRIAVARALIRKPDVLLLDEPTSALDVESERVVAETLDLVSSTRTCVIIAHRLQTIRNVDWIIVMEDGRVAEEGTHSSLLAKGGVYAKLQATYRNAILAAA